MPVLARVYGVPPKDQAALKVSEFDAIRRDYIQSQQEGGDEWHHAR